MRRSKQRGSVRHDREGRIQPAFALVLASLLVGFAVGAVMLLLARHNPEAPVSAGEEQITEGAPPAFADVAAEAGLHFRHESGSTGKFYYPEVMGPGCAWFDADGDGHLDIYLVNGNRLPPHAPSPETTDALYHNNGDGTFSDVTAESGLGDSSYGQGCCAADYDGDGDQDLYVTNFGPNRLYRNRGNGTFEIVEGMAADPGWGQACAFFDADGDGDLDLYVQNYLEYSLEDHQDWYVMVGNRKVLDYCSPSGYTGQQDRLFRNLGDGTLKDVTPECGLTSSQGTGMGLVCADLDDDGDQDIVVSNDSRPNQYFQNDGTGHFTECALMQGLAYNWEGGTEAFMGIDAGDFDGDGRLDLVIPSLRTQGFTLFRNLDTMFEDVSITTGIDAATSATTGFAPVFLDYDRDGDLDLYFTTGDVRMGRATAGVAASFRDRYAMADLLLENREGRFVDVSAEAGPVLEHRDVSRACAVGDYDNDGDLDLLITAMNGPVRLLRNDTAAGHWLGISLLGRSPNRDAVGAQLRLTAGGSEQVAEIVAGGSYLGQRDRRVLFGLAEVDQIEELTVRWPDGERSTYHDLEVDRYHEIRQEDAVGP